jgi:hypothetical protein
LVIQHARMVVALTTSFTPIAAKPRDSRLGIFSRTSDRFGLFSFVGQGVLDQKRGRTITSFVMLIRC